MQISQESTIFNGSFMIKKLPRGSKNDFYKNFAQEKQSIYYKNIHKTGTMFISVPDKNDRSLLELLNQGISAFTYYPQLKRTSIKNKTEQQILKMVTDIIPSTEKVISILNLLKIKIQNPVISDDLHGIKKVRNPHNNDIVLITPQNAYGTNYVKVIPGVSQTDDYYVKRYSVRENEAVKQYNDIDQISSFTEKCKNTLIKRSNG